MKFTQSCSNIISNDSKCCAQRLVLSLRDTISGRFKANSSFVYFRLYYTVNQTTRKYDSEPNISKQIRGVAGRLLCSSNLEPARLINLKSHVPSRWSQTSTSKIQNGNKILISRQTVWGNLPVHDKLWHGLTLSALITSPNTQKWNTDGQCGNEFTIHRQQINRWVYQGTENTVYTKIRDLYVVEYIHDNSSVC
jgi:hypothetical protein